MKNKVLDFCLFGKKKGRDLVRVSIVNPETLTKIQKGQKSNLFFQIDVENLFLRVEKKLDIHIDQKFYALSIAAIF